MYIHVEIHTIRKLYNHSYVFWWITPQNKYHNTHTTSKLVPEKNSSIEKKL